MSAPPEEDVPPPEIESVAPQAKRTKKMDPFDLESALAATRGDAADEGDPVVEIVETEADTADTEFSEAAPSAAGRPTLRPTTSVAAPSAEWPVDEPDI